MAASTFIASPETKQATESKMTTDAGETTKKTSESFSHVNKLSVFLQSDSLGNMDNCLFTARSVVHLLTGKPVIFQSNKSSLPLMKLVKAPSASGKLSPAIQIPLPMAGSPFERFEGTFTDFYTKKGNNYTFSGIVDLLQRTKKPEHAIYHITFCNTIHAFVIEKISDEAKVSFRVYHSWRRQFNLREGLERHPDEMDGDALIKFITSIQKICESSFQFWSRQEAEDVTDTVTLIKYPFDPSRLDLLLYFEQNKFKNFQLKADEVEKISNTTLRGMLSLRR